MDSLTQDFPGKFLNNPTTPCISLYQTTHRTHPENEQDVIRFKNLVKKIEQSLQKKYTKEKTNALLQAFYDLEKDFSFWNHNDEGLAILANDDFFKVYKLSRPVPELAIVADSFHIKPLIRIVQSSDHYQILALNRQEIKLFQGNRDTIQQIQLHELVPNNLEKALGDELTSPRLTVSSYGMGTKGPAMHHGHGGKKDEINLDIERFFRVVDQAILTFHSKTSGLPLLLAALPEYHNIFHKISHNPYLLENGIKINPDGLSIDKLRNEAWKHILPRYLERLDKLLERFYEAQPKNLASDNLSDISKEANTGRVDTLLIEADRQIPGKIDKNSGTITFDEIMDPEVGDVLDDLGEIVLKAKGDVIVVPSDKMPTRQGAAAIYRY